MLEYTREELISLCEAAIVPESHWHDRDSSSAQCQLGEAWALLRAGCAFEIEENTDDRTIWVEISYKGLMTLEVGSGKESDLLYIPTQARLNELASKLVWSRNYKLETLAG